MVLFSRCSVCFRSSLSPTRALSVSITIPPLSLERNLRTIIPPSLRRSNQHCYHYYYYQLEQRGRNRMRTWGAIERENNYTHTHAEQALLASQLVVVLVVAVVWGVHYFVRKSACSGNVLEAISSLLFSSMMMDFIIYYYQRRNGHPLTGRLACCVHLSGTWGTTIRFLLIIATYKVQSRYNPTLFHTISKVP